MVMCWQEMWLQNLVGRVTRCRAHWLALLVLVAGVRVEPMCGWVDDFGRTLLT